MSAIRQFFIVVALAALLGCLDGCATPGPVLTESVGTIRSGLGSAREQARLAFESANRIALEQAIERKLDHTEALTLAEKDFAAAVARDDADQWIAAFGVLDSYASALQKLVDPQLSTGTGDALQSLGEQLQNGQAIHAKLPSGAAGAFATFGQALIQAHAEKQATAIMRQVDPQFTAVTSGMADAIGADNGSGLRATVKGNWQTVLSGINSEYADNHAASRDARRGLIQQYLDALAGRDQQLADLEQLRVSLLALGEAHAAAARGNHGEATYWIERIDGWLKEAKRRAGELEQARNPSQPK